MKHIITGGLGFIGINLAKALIKMNEEVVILDNFSNSINTKVKSTYLSNKIQIIESNLDIKTEALNAFEKAIGSNKVINNVWHLAANSNIPSGVKNIEVDFKDTFLTTFNSLEACKIFKIKNFYFASSSAIFGDHKSKIISENEGPLMPLSNYGAMKLASEALCFAAYENFLNNLRVFRFPNVVGCPATHGVIKDFLKKLDKDENCLNVLGNGSQEKSYLHVSDLIKAMIYLSDTNLRINDNPIFNLGPNNDSVKVSWIAEKVVKYYKPNAKIKYGSENKGWLGDVPKFFYDTTKANDYGWKASLSSEKAVLKAIKEIISDHKTFI